MDTLRQEKYLGVAKVLFGIGHITTFIMYDMYHFEGGGDRITRKYISIK